MNANTSRKKFTEILKDKVAAEVLKQRAYKIKKRTPK